MVSGAFARFDHDHFFEQRDGCTLMRDVFDYYAPRGPLGFLAERTFLTRYMRRLLWTRMCELKRLAESGDWMMFVTESS